jgi:hypothetical protein
VTGSAKTLRRAALLALVGCLAFAAPAAAKKKGGKKGGGGTVDITKTVNAPIPDRVPVTAPLGTLVSTIDVGKQARGRQIRDVDVTVQTLGVSGTDPGDDLLARLTAPDGTNAYLFTSLGGYTGAPSVSIGPLTLDDEALFDLGGGPPIDPTRLNVPWAGTAQPSQQLWPMDGGPVRGTWTLHVFDFSNGETSSLVSWGIHVATSRPYLHK